MTFDPRVTAEHIVNAISPLLRGFPPEIQGAVLADLVSMWLAGHMGPGAPELREELLAGHIELVRELIPVNEKIILERIPPAGRS